MIYKLLQINHSFLTSIKSAIRAILIHLGIKPRLYVAQIAVTYHCNGRCPKCSIHLYKTDKAELGTEEVKSVIDQLCNIGVGRLGFFGGEPLLRNDLFELIQYASVKDIQTEIFTNGHFLSKKTVKKLKHAGLHRISISIDSSNYKLHDRLRRIPGCFSKALIGIKHCVNQELFVVINTVATKKNLYNGDLEGIIRLGKSLGVNRVKIIPPTMAGCWFDAKREVLNLVDYKKITQLKKKNFVVSEVENLGQATQRVCLCRTNNRIYVSPYGDVQPCWAIPLSFGNVRKNSLKSVWLAIGEYMKKYKSSLDCIANDVKFKSELAGSIKRIKTKLPLRVMIKNP